MQRRAFSIVVAGLLAGLGMTARAQVPGQALQAELRAPLVLPNIAVLPDASGTVTIDARSGTATVTGNLVMLTGTASAAEMQITGTAGLLVSVRVPAQATLRSQGGGQLALRNLHLDQPATVRLDNSGRAVVRIGAKMIIAAGLTPGQYRGQLLTTVDYVFE